MSQQHPMAMGGMGGPVGGPVAQPANAGTPTNSNFTPDGIIKKLNTAIYDYLLCNEKYEVARVFHKSMRDEIEYATEIKQSPNQRQNQPNGVDGSMDVDSKEHPGIQKRPSDLPPPHSLSSEDSPFLQDWWCQFWELYHGNRQKGKPTTLSYVGTQRQAMKQRAGLVAGADPNGMRPGYNGMMNGAGDLRAQAMKNGMTQQQMQQQQQMQMKRAQQGQQTPAQGGEGMQRQNSQMSGSPNTGGGDAPSPKRQRVDGNVPQMNQQQQRPGQPGQMQGGNQSVEVYSQAMQQQMQKAMQSTTTSSISNTNKGMPQTPSMGPGGAQSSPMAAQGMDASNGEFAYNQRMGGMPPAMNNGATQQAQGGNNGNHALQDYQMQLMLLEQQNKKRLLMARQEQDSMAHPPNGGRGSPQPNMMDPASNPQMRAQMMGPNGQPMMRPPSSHPMGQMGGQPMNPQQMEMMRQQQGQMMNGQFAGQPPPGQMMQGQQPPQGGPPGQPPNMTPRPGNMAPPPAPANAQGGTQPSSPAQAPAPPTPSQANKAKPGTKKGDNKKGAANQKKGADNPTEAAPPTPTPPPPVTPSNAASFQQNKNMQNGQPQGQPMQQGQQPNAGQAPGPDMPFGDLGNGDQFNTLDFANLESGDVLDNFDFDSFLNSGDGGGDGLVGFDAQFAFGDGIETDMGN